MLERVRSWINQTLSRPAGSPRRIAYVLDAPELCGGVKVVFQHAALLAAQGIEVVICGRGPCPDWISIPGRYVDLSKRVPRLGDFELVIATYWTTVAVAHHLKCGPVAHFCQGYEGFLDHLLPQLSEIESVYRLPLPTLTVTPFLADFLKQRFGRESVLVPPPVDAQFGAPLRSGPHAPARIVIPGIFECELKRVRVALDAIVQLQASGVSCVVTRLSTLPLSSSEAAILKPDRYLCCVPPRDVAQLLRQTDILLFPSSAGEGFGLPVLEALAAGVPVIASRIPSMEFVGAQSLTLVSPDDSTGMASAAREILSNPVRWHMLAERGQLAAQRFSSEAITRQLLAGIAQLAESKAHAAGRDLRSLPHA
ncbi:MAG TPA: glycosyltransferase family 4 protein [Acidobacteriota bacterium]|nr:glycosyltransferase family 4 protein [Acidobacteriota bacterium]